MGSKEKPFAIWISMDALEIVAAVTSAGRFSLVSKEVENAGAGAVRPFRAAQAPHAAPNVWPVENGSMLTLKLLPETETPAGNSWSTDSVVSSMGTIHRCSRIGGSVGTSHPAKRRHPATAVDTIRKRFMRHSLDGMKGDTSIARSVSLGRDAAGGGARVESTLSGCFNTNLYH